MIDVNDRGTLTALTIAALVFWPVTLVVVFGLLVVETIKAHKPENME